MYAGGFAKFKASIAIFSFFAFVMYFDNLIGDYFLSNILYGYYGDNDRLILSVSCFKIVLYSWIRAYIWGLVGVYYTIIGVILAMEILNLFGYKIKQPESMIERINRKI